MPLPIPLPTPRPLLALALLWLAACDDVPFGPPEAPAEQLPEAPNTDEIFALLFEPHCTSCHHTGGTPPSFERDALTGLIGAVSTGYAPLRLISAGAPEDSVLYTKVAGLGPGAIMPLSGPLPAEEVELLERWVRSLAPTEEAGAPDAGAPDAGAPDAGAPDAGAPDAGAPDAGAPDAG